MGGKVELFVDSESSWCGFESLLVGPLDLYAVARLVFFPGVRRVELMVGAWLKSLGIWWLSAERSLD
ncbi:hypothetical protein CFELI_09255 [Corynebacterium felinum]|uniref:Uncharacterized protein n=1 Tax=Corynebacterium felinum TaxID=131318 RepID=A0ABU2BCP3_9CORY|nr:hypothetical protein [Corynebacterium felinum]WJY95455.1 hypothetical protein CFELI_09255 [Corynebacterium felinum]